MSDEEEDDHNKIEIIDKREIKGKVEYKVHWKKFYEWRAVDKMWKDRNVIIKYEAKCFRENEKRKIKKDNEEMANHLLNQKKERTVIEDNQSNKNHKKQKTNSNDNDYHLFIDQQIDEEEYDFDNEEKEFEDEEDEELNKQNKVKQIKNQHTDSTSIKKKTKDNSTLIKQKEEKEKCVNCNENLLNIKMNDKNTNTKEKITTNNQKNKTFDSLCSNDNNNIISLFDNTIKVLKIITVTNRDNKLYAYVEYKNLITHIHKSAYALTSQIAKTNPQLLISFYENRLRFFK